MQRIDLHSHTTHSDGTLTPDRLLARAAMVGVSHLAITDHDTITALLPAAREAEAHGIELVPGIEMTVLFNGRECHLLGLGFCPTYEPLVAWSEQRKAERYRRIEHMLSALAPLGVHVTLEEVLAESDGKTLGRPHLARAMIKRGYVDSFQSAFDRFLTRREITEVTWPRPTSREAIALIHEAGGVTSIAHPGANRISRKEMEQLARDGLDAVEAAHHEHDPSQVGTFKRWAKDFDLCWTGGSDFHGGTHIPAELGACVTPAEQWEALQARAATRGESEALAEARRRWEISRLEAMPSEHPRADVSGCEGLAHRHSRS